MARIFFKKESLNKYKIAVINNALDEFIKAIKLYEPTKFEVVYIDNENSNYPHYDISGIYIQ